MPSKQNTNREGAARKATSDEGDTDDDVQTNDRHPSMNNNDADGDVKAVLDVDLDDDDFSANSFAFVKTSNRKPNYNDNSSDQTSPPSQWMTAPCHPANSSISRKAATDDSDEFVKLYKQIKPKKQSREEQVQNVPSKKSSQTDDDDLIKEREKQAGKLLKGNISARTPARRQRSGGHVRPRIGRIEASVEPESSDSFASHRNARATATDGRNSNGKDKQNDDRMTHTKKADGRQSGMDDSNQWVKHFEEHMHNSNKDLLATNDVASKKLSQTDDDDLIKEKEKQAGKRLKGNVSARTPARRQRSGGHVQSTIGRISGIEACVEPENSGSFASQRNARATATDGHNSNDKDKQNHSEMAEIERKDEILSSSGHSRYSNSGEDEKARERAARHAARRGKYTPRLVSSARSSKTSSSKIRKDKADDKRARDSKGNYKTQESGRTSGERSSSFMINANDVESDESIPELEYYEDRCERADAHMFEEDVEAPVQPGAYHIGGDPEEYFDDTSYTRGHVDSFGGNQNNNTDTSALPPLTVENPSPREKNDLIKATMVEDVIIPRAMAVSEVTERWKKMFCTFWGSVIAVPVICAVIVLTVKFFKDVPDELVPSSMPSEVPSPSPTSTAQGIIESIYPEINEAFTNSDSHESKALYWIENAYGGQSELLLPNYRIVQRFVLACLYYATGGDTWITSEYWLTDENECTWFEPTKDVYIKCDDDSVIHDITIRHNRLNGILCPEISFLSNLRSLDLSNNRIEGSLATELRLMSSLEKLSIGGNRLYGSIPTELSLLSNNLSELRLGVNTITGTLPSVLGLMTSLSVLQLNDNTLSGQIPTLIGLLSNLTLLSLEDNLLSGSIPTQLSGLFNLEGLELAKNDLTGLLPSIPSRDQQPSNGKFFSMLKHLSLESNSISGTIPDAFKMMTNLVTINLGHNVLSGSLPAHSGSWVKLRSINLERNYLFGELPSQIGTLTQLETLKLRGNSFTGILPSYFQLLPRLKTVDLQSNQIRGAIPSFLGGVSSLELLDMSWNELAGSLPSELGAMTNLKYLALGGNVDLTGTIPTVLGRLTNLGTLLLSPGLDQLTGQVPTEVCDLRRNFGLDMFRSSFCHDMKCDCCHDHCPFLPNSNYDDDNKDDNGPLSCPTGSSLLQIVIGTDANPEGLQWVVKTNEDGVTNNSSSSSSSILVQDGPYTQSKDRHQTIVREVCVPDDTCGAHFTILNANADGTVVGSLGGGDSYTIYGVKEGKEQEMIASGIAYAHVNDPIPIILGKDCVPAPSSPLNNDDDVDVVPSCSDDDVMLRIEITLERDPQRTSWSLLESKPTTTNLLLLEGGPYDETKSGTTIVKRTCVTIDSCLKFQMEDESSVGTTGIDFNSILTNVKLWIDDTAVGGVVYVGSPTTVWQGASCGLE